MNTKKEIVKFLNELALGVQGKRDNLEKQIATLTKQLNTDLSDLIRYDLKVNKRSFEDSLEHVEGQLYEINYILETITRDGRKKYV